MKRLLIIAAGTVLLAACAPPPLCDRANIEWTKYGTAEIPLECRPARYVPVLAGSCEGRCDVGGHNEHPVGDPPVDHPVSEPPTSEPERGNPGNDKPVGRAGEKIGKGMAERGTVGNRGKSN